MWWYPTLRLVSLFCRFGETIQQQQQFFPCIENFSPHGRADVTRCPDDQTFAFHLDFVNKSTVMGTRPSQNVRPAVEAEACGGKAR